MSACREFRERLESRLSGAEAGLTELSWHEHLLSCAGCRALLETEEALEMLLSTLPDPQLPPALARRVLARLAAVRDETERVGAAGNSDGALDALLALDETGPAPDDLAGGVLAGLRPHRQVHRDRALDAVLDRWSLSEPPSGLSERVLLGLEGQRGRRRPQLVRRVVTLAAAAVVLVGFGVWMYLMASSSINDVHGPPDGVPDMADETLDRGPRGDIGAPEPVQELVGAPEVRPQPEVADDWPSEELLDSLELLESWDLLNNDELDLALASLDAVDEVLLDLEAEGI